MLFVVYRPMQHIVTLHHVVYSFWARFELLWAIGIFNLVRKASRDIDELLFFGQN